MNSPLILLVSFILILGLFFGCVGNSHQPKPSCSDMLPQYDCKLTTPESNSYKCSCENDIEVQLFTTGLALDSLSLEERELALSEWFQDGIQPKLASQEWNISPIIKQNFLQERFPWSLYKVQRHSEKRDLWISLGPSTSLMILSKPSNPFSDSEKMQLLHWGGIYAYPFTNPNRQH